MNNWSKVPEIYLTAEGVSPYMVFMPQLQKEFGAAFFERVMRLEALKHGTAPTGYWPGTYVPSIMDCEVNFPVLDVEVRVVESGPGTLLALPGA